VKLLSPKSVAEALDINRRVAYRMMKDGRLPAFQLMKGKWRTYESALEKFVREKEKGKIRSTDSVKKGLNFAKLDSTKSTSGEGNEQQTPDAQASDNHR